VLNVLENDSQGFTVTRDSPRYWTGGIHEGGGVWGVKG